MCCTGRLKRLRSRPRGLCVGLSLSLCMGLGLRCHLLPPCLVSRQCWVCRAWAQGLGACRQARHFSGGVVVVQLLAYVGIGRMRVFEAVPGLFKRCRRLRALRLGPR